MNNVVEVRKLWKAFNDYALKGINLDIPEGYVTGLIGPNGAGKTTLIKCITGEYVPTVGSVSFADGVTRRDIGSFFTSLSETGKMYMKPKQLSGIFARMFKGWDEGKYFSLLDGFGVDRGKNVSKLSSGMVTKLQIAIALSHETRLLLLDEPTVGLDPAAREDFLDMLRKYIADEGKTVLISSHITSDLEKIADKTVYIEHGNVIISGFKDDIESEYGIARLGHSSPSIDGQYVVSYRNGDFGSSALIHNKTEMREAYPDVIIDDASLEDIMIYLARGEKQ